MDGVRVWGGSGLGRGYEDCKKRLGVIGGGREGKEEVAGRDWGVGGERGDGTDTT